MANLSNINGKFVVEQTTGYVGVGTTDPNFLIEAAGANSEIALNSTSASIYRLRSTSSDSFIITKNGVGDRLVIAGNGNATFSGSVTVPSVLANSFMEIRSDTASLYFENAANNNYYRLKRSSNDFVIDYYNGTTTSDRLTIDSSGNVGIEGTPSTFANYTNVTIKGGSSGSNLDFKNSSGTRVAAIVSNPSSDFGIETNEATPILFKTNGSERMRIEATGVMKFPNTATSTGDVGTIAHYTNNYMYIRGGTGGLAIGDDGFNTNIYLQDNDSILFGTTGLERMRINSQGQMWLGGTYTGSNIANGNTNYLNNLNAGSFSILHRNSSDAYVHFNTYYTSSNTYVSKYSGRGFMLGYNAAADDGFFFSKAPSTTAGQNQTFSQVMTVGYGTSNNVGIGTTTPDEKLDVAGKVQVTGNSLTVINASDPVVTVSDTDTNYRGSMRWLSSSNVLEFFTRYAGTYYTNNLVLDRGKVGIGTDSPIAKQHNVITSNGTALLLNNSLGGPGAYVDLDFNTYSVTAAGFANAAASIRVIDDGAFSGNIAFRTKGASIGASQTERMRILSTGAISVGSSGTAYGTAGQVLTSNGNASPSWQAAGGSAWPQEKFAEYTIDSTTSNILVATMNSTTWHGNYLAGCLKFTMSTGDYIQVTYVPVSTFLSGSNKWFFKGTEMTSKNNGSNSALLVFTFAGDQGTFGSTCTLKINRSFNVSNYTKVNVLVQAISNPNMFILN